MKWYLTPFASFSMELQGRAELKRWQDYEDRWQYFENSPVGPITEALVPWPPQQTGKSRLCLM